MSQTESAMNNYFSVIQEKGNIISEIQAKRWSESVLKMMGLAMGKKGKKALSNKLPEALANDLNRVFRLIYFRDVNLPLLEFQTMVARRGGHSDPQFAKMAIIGVFHGLKTIVDQATSDQVADALSPELSETWQNA